MKKLLAAIIIAGIAAYGILDYHYILFDKKLKIIKKSEPSLTYTFIDARGTKILDVATNPVLIKAGFQDIVKDMKKQENNSQ